MALMWVNLVNGPQNKLIVDYTLPVVICSAVTVVSSKLPLWHWDLICCVLHKKITYKAQFISKPAT